jgi:23S rRNA pseudouridine1911/1915/1917 synthase
MVEAPSIVIEDGPILAINKPAGLATEAPAGIPSLVEWVKAFLKERDQKPGGVYLGVPHRLDRPVSGVVVFAKNSKAAARMAEQFRDRQVKKEYLAVVEGVPDPPSGTLVHWTAKNDGEAKARVVEPLHPNGRECLLRYETILRFEIGTLLRIELGTGRFHQIRVQMSTAGHPVVGDGVYGGASLLAPHPSAAADDLPRKGGGDSEASWPFGSRHSELPTPNTALRTSNSERSKNENEPAVADSLLLHAWRLTFFHPVRYDLVSASAPLPGHWPADVRAVVADAETRPNLHPHP